MDSEFYTEEIQNIPEYSTFVENQTSFEDGFVRCFPSGSLMPRCFTRIQQRIRHFEVKEDDIWISSFPKCGTTWTQEMVWNIVHGVDLATATSISLEDRVPFFELTGLIEERFIALAPEETRISGTGLVDSLNQVVNANSPRIIKTHLPVDLLPSQVLEKKVKLIYVSRNPRDVVVSFYNHWRIMEGYTGDFDTFFDAFLSDVAGYYCPFIQHNSQYWDIRERENVLFITYENMKKDLPSVLRTVCDFLGKELTQTQITALTEHLNFDSMKKNKAVNKEDVVKALSGLTGSAAEGQFMRQGQAGAWRDKLTPQQVERMQSWEDERLQQTDLRFVYSV